MGMSSSQARMLSLTGRMHDIEYKAQRIEAQKLQLANDSERAYADYLEAIDAKKLQYRSLSTDGSVTYCDATPNILQNGMIPNYSSEHIDSPLFLQKMDGKVMVTRAVADAFGLHDLSTSTDMDTYLTSTCHLSKSIKYGTKFVDDTTSVNSFTPIQTVQVSSYSPASYSYNNIVTNTSTVHTGITHLESGTTYTVGSAADLIYLSNLINVNGDSTDGITIELSNDIDMTGQSYTNFGLINASFNGNGHTVSGLTTGLFSGMRNSTIENVSVSGNVSTNGSAGLLVMGDSHSDTYTVVGSDGTTTTTFGQNYIRNVIASGSCSISTTNPSSVGGLIGGNSGQLTIENVTVNVNVNGSNEIGGIIGHNGWDASSNNSDIQLNISNSIYNGVLTYTLPKDGFGSILGKMGNQTVVNIENCSANLLTGSDSTSNIVGTGSNSTNTTITNDSTPTGAILAATGVSPDAVSVNVAGQPYSHTYAVVPNINSDGTGGLYSNILAALNKSNHYDSNSGNSATEQKVKDFITLFNDNDTDNFELYFLNQRLASYLSSNNADVNFTNALWNDINNGVKTNTQSYRQGDTTGFYGAERATTNSSWTPTYTNAINGIVNIPNKDTIKQEIFVAFKKAYGNTIATNLESQINSYIDNKYNTSNKADLASLAYINDMIHTYSVTNSISAISNLKSKIEANVKITNKPSYIDNVNHYNINMAGSAETFVVNYNQQEVPDYDHPIYYWDTTIPAVQNGMKAWIIGQRGVEIIEEPLASDYEYLKNLIETGTAVLTTFNPENIDALNGLDANDVINMTDAEYNDMMGIVNTNVPKELGIEEVADEKDVKKAQADYEANMRKIDMKDRKYDTELASCENERNAIKTELDTLKNVSKDNVDRTFKLFS